MSKEKIGNNPWTTVEREVSDIWCVEVQRGQWDKFYGKGNWRLVWQLPSKEILNFDQLFLQYVDAYAKYFEDHYYDALFLTSHFAYVYCYDYISKEEAFNPYASYDQAGKADQFHHVAINLALVDALGLEFKGSTSVGRDEARFWEPDQIPPCHPELIPYESLYPSLAAFHKNARILQIKK